MQNIYPIQLDVTSQKGSERHNVPFTNALIMHGQNNGKKLMAIHIVKCTFEIIHLLTGENPLQIFVIAIINSGPREASTRIGRAGTVRRRAV